MRKEQPLRGAADTFFLFSWKNTVICAGILAAAAALCFLFRLFDDSDVYVALIFELAVVLVSRFTSGYFYGLLASVVGVIGVNYIFTYPYFALNFTISGYPLTFLVMLAVSIVVSALTTQIKQQEKIRADTEKEKMRGTLLRAVSHDLRTPLTRMIGRSEVTVSGNPSLEDVLNTLGDNTEECRGMLVLINQMLEISKTESGAIVPERRELDLSALLERSVELFRLPAEQKGQEIVLNLPERPVHFCGDSVKLQRLVGNLLDNAMKFTPPQGRITVALKQSAQEIVLRVSDTGCGIPAEEREKVFKRFFRADSSRHLPGNGLGLALVQAIAKAHGGSVGLESEPGRGSVFTVRLPV